MVSNSSAPAIAELYQHPRVTRAGLRLHQLPARRSINSRGSARGPIVEFLLTNLTERGWSPSPCDGGDLQARLPRYIET